MLPSTDTGSRTHRKALELNLDPRTCDTATGRLITVLDPAPTKPAEHLRQFVLGFDHLRALEPSDPALLSIRAADVLKRIQAGDPGWISMVPPSVAERIQAKHLFAQTAVA